MSFGEHLGPRLAGRQLEQVREAFLRVGPFQKAVGECRAGYQLGHADRLVDDLPLVVFLHEPAQARPERGQALEARS